MIQVLFNFSVQYNIFKPQFALNGAINLKKKTIHTRILYKIKSQYRQTRPELISWRDTFLCCFDNDNLQFVYIKRMKYLPSANCDRPVE